MAEFQTISGRSPRPPVPSSFDFPLLADQHGSRGSGSSFKLPGRRRHIRHKTRGNRVLMFGLIRELALYRAAVLRDRGFDVITPSSLAEMTAVIRHANFDIAVLTYTLPNDIVQQLAQLVRENCPNCPLIVICSSTRVDREIRPDEMVNAEDGPAALIAALRRVTQIQ